MAETNDNMQIWNAVCETKKENTKEVSYGSRHFTAIDAYSQIEKATKLWGAIGTGWKVEQSIIRETDTELVMLIAVSYLVGETWSFPVYGYGCVSINPKKTDHAKNDSHKKTYTDGLTKALSFLGFDFDVFSGKFDDKYKNNPESTDGKDPKKTTETASPKTEPEPGNGKSDNMMTAEQRKKIFALVNEKNLTAYWVKFKLVNKYNIDSTKHLSKKQASEFIDVLEKVPMDEGDGTGGTKEEAPVKDGEDSRNTDIPS